MKKFAEIYFNVLRGTLKGLNLVGMKDDNDFYVKQVLDSILPLEEDTLFRKHLKETKLLVDIGFGGGFPLLPLAYKLGDSYKFLGFESKRKKVDAVQILSDELGLENVEVFHERLETLFFDRPCVVTFKAVGRCLPFLQKIHTNQEIIVYFYKGSNFLELEGDDLKKIEKRWKIIENKEMILEKEHGRRLIGFQRKKNCMDKFKSSLTSLSEFII